MSAPLTPGFCANLIHRTMHRAFAKPVVSLRESSKTSEEPETRCATPESVAAAVVVSLLALCMLAFNVVATVKFVNARVVCAEGAAMWAAIAILALTWVPVPVISPIAWIVLVIGAFTTVDSKWLGGMCK